MCHAANPYLPGGVLTGETDGGASTIFLGYKSKVESIFLSVLRNLVFFWVHIIFGIFVGSTF